MMNKLDPWAFESSNPKLFFLYKERHPNVSAEHLAISPNGDNERYAITTLTSFVLTMCTKGRLPSYRQTALFMGP